jgi:TatD DNase family protein
MSAKIYTMGGPQTISKNFPLSTFNFPLIDSHCHLNFPDFDVDRENVIANARAAGIEKMILIGTNRNSNPQVLALTQQYDFIYCALGIHPFEANDYKPEDLAWIEAHCSQPKVVALGECGLDYHYEKHDKDKQQALFRWHIALSQKIKLPLVIHNRNAHADLLSILNEFKNGLTGHWHCFDGTLEHAKAALDLGLHIGFTGPLTYKTSDALRQVAAEIPRNRLLLETDSPYLPPVPFRGQRNEPAYLIWTAKKLAEQQNTSLEDIARATFENTVKLYRLS